MTKWNFPFVNIVSRLSQCLDIVCDHLVTVMTVTLVKKA